MWKLLILAVLTTTFSLVGSVSTTSAQTYYQRHHHNSNYGRGYNSGYNNSGSSYSSGAYQIQNERAVSLAIQNNIRILEFNREWRMQLKADHLAVIAEHSEHNIEADLRHFRDQPTASAIASGAALNYLTRQYGDKLSSVDFRSVTLTTAELASIRLKTADGITMDGLTETEDVSGKIRWPEELQADELSNQRIAVEESLKKLQKLEPGSHPAQTQMKRVEHEIAILRSEVGTVLRDQKHDEIGTAASRDFLRQLQSRIAQAGDETKLRELRAALLPEVKSAGELMRHMAKYEVHFAPCADPAAPAYHLLQDCLAEAHRQEYPTAQSLQAAR
jgi:hypothetical protein